MSSAMGDLRALLMRKSKRWSLYLVGGTIVWHYVYYTIEMNEKVRKAEERKDMVHIRWLKRHIPYLRAYGIPYNENGKKSTDNNAQ